MAIFPIFKSHNDVICFKCGADVPSTGEGDRRGYGAPGRGQFASQRCPVCTMRTWYDLRGWNHVTQEHEDMMPHSDACMICMG